jgi:flagellar basal-body rod protein FlgF
MDPLTISAASGLRARMESLEMLANNLANAATGGYKTDREFYSLYTSAEAAGGDGGPAATLPVVERPWTDFSAGNLRVTDNPLDLALEGPGFFAVDGAAGPLYTRNGSFRLAPDGSLLAAEGYPVRTAGGTPLRLAPGSQVTVNADGTVLQQGVPAGKLELVDFPDPAVLSKQGNTYFRAAGPNAAPVPAAAAVHQGKLEQSNVAAPEGAVRLISLMRQFEMLQKAVTIGGEMNRRAVEEVARPNS